MAERRADAGSGGEHGGDAGHDRHLDVAPRLACPVSIASNTALAMANTPGSPQDTTATDLARSGEIERLLARGPAPRDCPRRAGAGRRAPARGRDRAHSRRGRWRRQASPTASGVISSGAPGPSPTMARRPVIAASSRPAPARWRNRRRRRRACRRADDALLGHGAALDIDGAIELAGAGERLPDLGEVAPDLHDHRGVAGGEPRRRARRRPWCRTARRASRRRRSSAWTALVQQPVMAVMPGITSHRCVSASRSCRCM